jgi:hypothetical protein
LNELLRTGQDFYPRFCFFKRASRFGNRYDETLKRDDMVRWDRSATTPTPNIRRLLAAGLLVLVGSAAAGAEPPVVQVSADPFENSDSQHQTEVEPDTASVGNSVLSAFQAGRFAGGGGSSGIGWAYTEDQGASWNSGFLPALTVNSIPPGPADRATNPSVAYDSVHKSWLIATLTLKGSAPSSAVVVSRSADGRNWREPVTVSAPQDTFKHDKSWITCDNSASSPFQGRCYVSWTAWDEGGTILTSRSTDGGSTWSAPAAASDRAKGTGAQPVVRPDGTLVVVALDFNMQSLGAIGSIDGGQTFSNWVPIASVSFGRPTEMRADPFPSVDIDDDGRIYAAWSDCRFRPGCPGVPNDFVMSTSDDGVHWSQPKRLELQEPTSGGSDHLIPGLAVDRSTGAANARLALTYYRLNSPCDLSLCELSVEQTSSPDGGETWNPTRRLNSKPIQLTWLASTELGRMVGDYISTSITGDKLISVVPLADAPGPGGRHQQHMFAAVGVLDDVPSPQPAPEPERPFDLTELVTDLLGLLKSQA